MSHRTGPRCDGAAAVQHTMEGDVVRYTVCVVRLLSVNLGQLMVCPRALPILRDNMKRVGGVISINGVYRLIS